MAIAKNVFIHPSSYVDKPVSIGEDTKIWHFCHISRDASIGKNCKIGQNVFIGKNVMIGNNVKIQNNVSVYEGVTLEDEVFIGPSAVFTNVLRPRSNYPVRGDYIPTTIGRGATISANVTVICGHTIGRYAFIGGGAVVTKDILDFELWFGNPAQRKGWVCVCGFQLDRHGATFVCKRCLRIYKKVKGMLRLDDKS